MLQRSRFIGDFCHALVHACAHGRCCLRPERRDGFRTKPVAGVKLTTDTGVRLTLPLASNTVTAARPYRAVPDLANVVSPGGGRWNQSRSR